MVNSKTLATLLTLIVILGAALLFFVVKSNNSVVPNKNKSLLHSILLQNGPITKLSVSQQGQSINLHLVGDTWAFVDKNNYPALQEKVTDFMANLENLKIVEPKTGNPELYNQLGLGDQALKVTLHNGQGKEVCQLFIGNIELDQMFVRLANNAQTWLVKGVLSISTNFSDWVEEPLLGLIDPRQVKQLTVNQGHDQLFTIAKITPEQEDFSFTPGKASSALELEKINSIPFKVAELEFNDVAAVTAQNINWNDPLVAKFETFNGMQIDLEMVRDGENVYAKVQATSFDDSNQELSSLVSNYNITKGGWYYKLDPSIYDYLLSQNI